MKAKILTAFLTALTIVLALSLAFAMPSGLLTLKAQEEHLNEINNNDEDFFDPSLFLNTSEEITYGVSGGGMPEGLDDIILGTGYSLPVDTTGGMALNPAGYTENSYQDDSIYVEVYDDFAYDSIIHVAYIKIADPSQLRTGVANSTQYTSVMAAKLNAVVAINGDYYTDRTGGIVVRQGKIIRQNNSKTIDSLFIDNNGNFTITKAGDNAALAAALTSENGVMNSFFFGPGLVIDGEIQAQPESYAFQMDSAQPRTMIGQVGDLTYIVCTVEGRQEGRSVGMTFEQMATYMKNRGCTQAYNLDGGNSSTFVFGENVYRGENRKERDVKDIIYFASAVDPTTWQ